MRRIDLNADVGEVEGDLAVLEHVTSVNIACGVHAGDAETMARAAAEARRLGLAIGAHPGYADREHMGRRAMDVTFEDVARLVREQVAALEAIAGPLTHVKPHGALYNQATTDASLARAIAEGVRDAGLHLVLVGLAGSAMISAAREAGLSAAAEAFADRRYRSDGTLASRGTPGALITDPAVSAAQAVAIATGAPVSTVDGPPIVVTAGTICIHGDTPGAGDAARAVRFALGEAGIALGPLSREDGAG